MKLHMGLGTPASRNRRSTKLCQRRDAPSPPWPLGKSSQASPASKRAPRNTSGRVGPERSEEHTSELQSLMRNSYAVSCLKKKKKHEKLKMYNTHQIK